MAMDFSKSKRERTFLSVTVEDPLALPGDDVPDPHMGIIAPRNKCSPSGGESTNRVLMTLQMKFVVWVLVHVLLYKHDVSR